MVEKGEATPGEALWDPYVGTMWGARWRREKETIPVFYVVNKMVLWLNSTLVSDSYDDLHYDVLRSILVKSLSTNFSKAT